MPRPLPYLFMLLTWLTAVALGSGSAFSQITEGHTVGWAYYGLLTHADPGGANEQWTDLDFAVGAPPSGSKIPVKGMQAKCQVTMSIRSGAVSVTNGTVQWPPITGLLAAGTVVKVVDIMTVPSSAGAIQYWVKIEKD